MEMARNLAGAQTVLAFVGPEGGWTEAELAGLTDRGCKPVSLGPHTLRIETAAIAVAALVHAVVAKDQSQVGPWL